MNVVNNTGRNRKITENDFQIRRPGQYKIPRIKKSQSDLKQTNISNQSKNVIDDGSIVRSRLVCRSDLLTPDDKIKETSGVETRTGLEWTASSSSTSRQVIPTNSSKLSTSMENGSNFVPKYNISQKIEHFVVKSNTPRQLIKTASSVTSTSVPVVSQGLRNKSRNSTQTKISDNKNEIINTVILGLTEGRGSAQGEIGLAAIDLKRPILILSQISDTQTYMNTINKINILNPAEILIPKTFMDQMQGTLLFNTIKSHFPLSTIITVSRKHFCENDGKLYLKNSVIPECTLTLDQVLPKFYAVSAAAALLKHIEFNHNVIFSSNTLKIEYKGIEKSMFIGKLIKVNPLIY